MAAPMAAAGPRLRLGPTGLAGRVGGAGWAPRSSGGVA